MNLTRLGSRTSINAPGYHTVLRTRGLFQFLYRKYNISRDPVSLSFIADDPFALHLQCHDQIESNSLPNYLLGT